MTAQFEAALVAGTAEPSAEDQAYVLERAGVCPVSRNVAGPLVKRLSCTYRIA